MQYPNLIIIAGCNGSGKSTFSKSLVNSVVPFDYDKKFLNNYRTLPDSELRHQFAKLQKNLKAPLKELFLIDKIFVTKQILTLIH